jgi:hypothetical protein
MNAFHPATAILVHERDPYWTPELQRRFVNAPVAVRQCDPVAQLDIVRANYASAVIVIDLRDKPTSVLKGLLERDTAGQFDPIIVLADETLADWEWTLRGLGVTSFWTQPPSGRELARLCRTALALTGTTAS